MPHLLALVIFFPALAVAQYQFDDTPIDSCWVEIGSYCQTEGVLADDAFLTDGTVTMKAINKAFQDQLDPLWVDNLAHPHTLVKEASQLYRTYQYCLSKLCNKIRIDCSAQFSNSTNQENFNRCNQRQLDLLRLSKSQVKSALDGNVDRKQRSLWDEKLKAINLRFDEFLYPRFRQANREIAEAANTILALARLLR